MARASLIVSTYNWPEALKSVLDALQKQTEKDFEIIIADDGSKKDTATLIQSYKNVVHVRQPDKGFRKSMILNKAVAKAKSEYLIFLDGDCIPREDFIDQHLKLRRPAHFVSGHRVMLDDDQTEMMLNNKIPELNSKQKFKLNGYPLGFLRKLNNSQWKNVKGCNLSLYKADYIAVGGYDESFEGWGYEDSDFIIRLGKIGIHRISGKFVTTVFHLEHANAPRDNQKENLRKLHLRMTDNTIIAPKGIDQYLKRPTLSVALITHNEADRIQDCLSRISFADEIIVVDDGSTDDTTLIAERFTKKVFRRDFDGFGAQKNFALSKCTKDWILALDADELITEDLQHDILNAIQQPKNICYAIRRIPYLRNKRIYFGDWGKDSVLRLFPRTKAKYSDKLVHEALETDLKQVTLKSPMKHFTINHVAEMNQKAIKYARLAAEGDLIKNKKANLSSPVTHAIWRFIRGYIIKLGFLDGINGFWIAYYCSKGTYLRYKNLLGLRADKTNGA